MRLRFDPAAGHATRAEFDSRLFATTSLCYTGSFPVARKIVVESQPDGAHVLHNAGSNAWPAGRLLAGGRALELPSLAPGARAAVAWSGQAAATGWAIEAPLRLAFTRLPPEGMAALWPLDLAGVGDAPAAPRGWLLVSVPSP
jgi:hypothetical protein